MCDTALVSVNNPGIFSAFMRLGHLVLGLEIYRHKAPLGKFSHFSRLEWGEIWSLRHKISLQ